MAVPGSPVVPANYMYPVSPGSRYASSELYDEGGRKHGAGGCITAILVVLIVGVAAVALYFTLRGPSRPRSKDSAMTIRELQEQIARGQADDAAAIAENASSIAENAAAIGSIDHKGRVVPPKSRSAKPMSLSKPKSKSAKPKLHLMPPADTSAPVSRDPNLYSFGTGPSVQRVQPGGAFRGAMGREGISAAEASKMPRLISEVRKEGLDEPSEGAAADLIVSEEKQRQIREQAHMPSASFARVPTTEEVFNQRVKSFGPPSAANEAYRQQVFRQLASSACIEEGSPVPTADMAVAIGAVRDGSY